MTQLTLLHRTASSTASIATPDTTRPPPSEMSDDAWAIPGFGAPRAQREEALERLDTVVGEHVTLCLQASAISSWQVVQPKHLSPSINIIEQERMMYQGLKQQRQGEIETSRSRLDLYFAWLWKLEDDVMGYVIRVTDRLHKDIRTHREAYKPVDRDQRFVLLPWKPDVSTAQEHHDGCSKALGRLRTITADETRLHQQSQECPQQITNP